MTEYEAIVERVAQAIYKANCGEYPGPIEPFEYLKIMWLAEARAAYAEVLAALSEAPGFDPEAVSYHDGMTRLDGWQAMLRAAPRE